MAAPRSVGQLDFDPGTPLHPSPRDWRDQFIYFLLVDRFDDAGQDPPALSPDTPKSDPDPGQGNRFQGGDLRGVERRLDYLQGLGCTAIWLSPVFKNRAGHEPSYHGYGVQDFLEVDSRFGSREDLQSLVRAAHDRGMYVIQDIIFNHTGDVWAYPGDQPYYYFRGQQFPFGFWREVEPAGGFQEDDAVWPVELQKPESFKRQGQIRDWSSRVEARDGDFSSLKELELRNPEVLDSLIKVYKHWIARTDVDGFRVDTVKHMEHSAVALFCNAIREFAEWVGKDNFFLYGEIVGDDATIQKYLGRNARIEGTHERFPSLDAALDFPLYADLEWVIKGEENPRKLRERYRSFWTSYADHGEAGRRFVTFLDNHDRTQRFMHANPYPDQAVLGIAYLLTSQGVPCIYYGTEQGLDGGGPDDDFVRECMFGGQWGPFGTTGHHVFDDQSPTYQGIRSVAWVRAQEPALRRGRQYFREISGDGVHFGHPIDGRATLAFSRILDTSEVLVALNLDAAPREDYITVDRNLSPPGTVLRNRLDPSDTQQVSEVEPAPDGRSRVKLSLPGHGVGIYRRD